MSLPKNAKTTIAELEEYSFSVLDKADEEEIADIVSDWLSDTFGFCHEGFESVVVDAKTGVVKVTGILWDTSE